MKQGANQEITYHHIKLPLTNLHYLKCGRGPPLVIVPATISEITNWNALVQFMAQRFTVHFFELPGHGGSSKFEGDFRSDLVAETVEDFIDAMGYDKVGIMGFSFGGILTVKTLDRIRDRVSFAIMIAPCVTHRALTHSKWQIRVMKGIARAMKAKAAQRTMLSIMHNRFLVGIILKLLSGVGNVEHNEGLRGKLLGLPASTLEVLVYQINEIMTVDFSYIKEPFKCNLYFGMSVRDPLLDYSTTDKELRKLFRHVTAHKLYLPYHQPPKPFTLDELNATYGSLLEKIEKRKVLVNARVK